MVFAVFLLRDEQPLPWLLLWLASNGLFSIWRLRRWRSAPASEVGRVDASRWMREATIANGINGAIWGVGAWAFLSHDNTAVMVLFLLVLISLTCGAALSLAANFNSVIAFCVPVTGFVAHKMWTQDFVHSDLLAASCLLYLVFVLSMGKSYANTISDAIRLSIENTELLRVTAVQKSAVERASAERSRFFAAVSHDLRQPIYALGLLLEALDRRLETPAQRRLFGDIQRVRGALDELFTSLLEVAEIDSHIYPVDVHEFPLDELLGTLIAEFRPAATRKGLTLEADASDLWLRTDRLLLSRILRNLMSNAIKFTSTGGVTISTEVINHRVKLTVADSGRGISHDNHVDIFSEHFQLANPERERSKGLGLGLSVVKRLCDLLEIELALESAPGEGSRFSLLIVQGTAGADPASDKWRDIQNFNGLHVLLIDDDASVRLASSTMLSDRGCTVTAAQNAAEALGDSAAERRPIDIVIADFHLADGENGLEAIAAVRNRLDPQLPALVISADRRPATRMRVEQAGIIFVSKPISSAELSRRIAELV